MIDRLHHGLGRRPALSPSQRGCLALSSMYSVADGRSDETLPPSFPSASPRDLLAWDLARLVHVARRGRHARFLSEAEAWEFLLGAGALAGPHFAGWEDFGQCFLNGRSAWAGGPDPRIERAVATLLERPESPWRRNPWDCLVASPA
jgi:hypothetical protein